MVHTSAIIAEGRRQGMKLFQKFLAHPKIERMLRRPSIAIIWQLLKEFFFPVSIALAWTVYNHFDNTKPSLSVQDKVNLFGVTLLSISFFFSQWFRVKKQLKVDAGLGSIEASVQRSLTEIENRTVDIISHITGGDSGCYLFGPKPEGDRWRGILVIHVGDHPLYEVSARIVDLDIFDELIAAGNISEPLASDFTFAIGNLRPGTARHVHDIELGFGDSRRFNIFFSARNEPTSQELRCKKVNGAWVFATRLRRSDTVLFELVQPGYPLTSEGKIDW